VTRIFTEAVRERAAHIHVDAQSPNKCCPFEEVVNPPRLQDEAGPRSTNLLLYGRTELVCLSHGPVCTASYHMRAKVAELPHKKRSSKVKSHAIAKWEASYLQFTMRTPVR
jgi:hypothetical protein